MTRPWADLDASWQALVQHTRDKCFRAVVGNGCADTAEACSAIMRGAAVFYSSARAVSDRERGQIIIGAARLLVAPAVLLPVCKVALIHKRMQA